MSSVCESEGSGCQGSQREGGEMQKGVTGREEVMMGERCGRRWNVEEVGYKAWGVEDVWTQGKMWRAVGGREGGGKIRMCDGMLREARQ